MTSIDGDTDIAFIETDANRFNWGAAIAGAIAATAVSFFLITLGAGVGLAFAPTTAHGAGVFFTLGAIYFFAAQAFGFTVGGYLVGRLIGPEVENTKEEEFRAAAHGFVMWALAIVVGLLLVGVSSVAAGSAFANLKAPDATPAAYWTDMLFRPAANSPGITADKAEAGRILAMGAVNDGDTIHLARMVSQDTGMPMAAAVDRVNDVEARMRTAATDARKAASIFSLWTAFALLFGAIVSVAAAISSRWMDDRITFSLAPRR
jgi:hypothetical protein